MADFKALIASEWIYECGGNWWWSRHSYMPARTLNISSAMLEADLQEKYTKATWHLGHEVVVGVSRDMRDAKLPEFDTLERISASEFDDCFLLAVHRSVQENSNNDLKTWRTAFLTVKFRCLAIDNEDAHMCMSIKLRDRNLYNAAVAGRTTHQRLLEFVRPATHSGRTGPHRRNDHGQILERQGRWHFRALWGTHL